MDRTHDRRPSLSCDECRRRKSKCDRIRPQCGNCVMSESRCTFPSASGKRGPKKGQLQALRARIGMLEQQLAAKDITWDMTYDFQDANAENLDGYPQCTQPNANAFEPESMETLMLDITPSLPWPENELIPLDPALEAKPRSSHVSSNLSTLALPALVDADLEQLFFDRVYHSAPIIHKGRYITSMDQEEPPPARVCLRLAICTSAAAFSAQYRDVGQRLYLETLQSLESLESNEHTLPWGVKDFQIEHIQAWLLLAIYEYMHMDKRQASSAISRALRLIQRCRLGDLDTSGVLTQDVSQEKSATKKCFAAMEEKRRTFWLAFCFERLLNTQDNLKWALPEEMIRLRVPASEASFQHSHETRMPLLSEVMTEDNSESLSPFAECVALMALYDRCVTHRQLVLTAVGDGGRESNKFWIRQNWLMGATEKRRRLLQAPDATPNILGDDPMLAFTHFFASSLAFNLVDTAALWPWHTPEQEELCSTYRQQACLAANEQTRAAESLLCFNSFKVHLFLPAILVGFVNFIEKRRGMADSEATDESCCDVRALTKILHRLKDMHRSAKRNPDQVLDRVGITSISA